MCGYFSKDDTSKMIFILEHVPSDQEEAEIAYQASSYFKALFEFFTFLNNWAVIEVDPEELEILNFNGVAGDKIDMQKYDFKVARETDRELLSEA